MPSPVQINMNNEYQPYKGPVFSGSRGGCSQHLLPGSIWGCVIKVELPRHQNLFNKGSWSSISNKCDAFKADRNNDLQPFWSVERHGIQPSVGRGANGKVLSPSSYKFKTQDHKINTHQQFKIWAHIQIRSTWLLKSICVIKHVLQNQKNLGFLSW